MSSTAKNHTVFLNLMAARSDLILNRVSQKLMATARSDTWVLIERRGANVQLERIEDRFGVHLRATAKHRAVRHDKEENQQNKRAG
jgi:hypothetical protein